MESKTTSKTSCLKALLLRAWRERWSDLQWGINIKTVLPRGVSGDVYNLADCILQQAVIGAGANQLVLSYLRHSLSAQLVSHAAVLQRLAKYNQFNKVHCIFSLLEFLEGMLPGITCCSKPEESVLATSILSITSWLLSILQNCSSTANVKQKATELLNSILQDDFYVAMLLLARYSDPDLFNEMNRICTELEKSTMETDESASKISKLSQLDIGVIQMNVDDEPWPGSLIQYWLEIRVTGDPAASTASLADQLRLFTRLKNYKESRLFAELIRGSLVSLHDVSQTPQESQWGAFAFLKVPYIITELSGRPDSVVGALELLMQHSPLLDAMDAHSACSNMECLLEELAKACLVTESQFKQLIEKNKAHAVPKLDTSQTIAGIPKVIICAEPSLAGILKTLSSDNYKIQDPLLGMLHQVLAGRTFELMLAVATVQGQLQTLVDRLILNNECSKSAAIGDTAKAQLFDITFLLLVSMVQTYGVDAVLEPGGDSVFEQWVHTCMVLRQRPKAPDQLLRLGDPVIVESLLQQFNSGETELKGSILWKDVLFNMPGVMKEVLVAWEQGALVTADVKRILEAVRNTRMNCLPISAAAWLCAYMRTAPQDTLLKPVNMVQQLIAAPTFEDENLREPWQLTCDIIRKMQRDVQLPLQNKGGLQLVSCQPATEQLHAAWIGAVNKGWLDHVSARTLQCLLDTAGARWLVSAVVQELLKLRFRDQLKRGVDLALAVFHVDVSGCTMELLSHVLPQLLYNDLQADSLVDPQLQALACLSSCCVYTAWDSLSEDLEEPPLKMAREENTPAERLLSYLKQLLDMLEGTLREGFVTQQTYFAFHLIKSMVEVRPSSGSAVLQSVPPALVSDLLRTLPELFEYPLIVNIHDVNTTAGRVNMARDLCVLRDYRLKCQNHVTQSGPSAA